MNFRIKIFFWNIFVSTQLSYFPKFSWINHVNLTYDLIWPTPYQQKIRAPIFFGENTCDAYFSVSFISPAEGLLAFQVPQLLCLAHPIILSVNSRRKVIGENLWHYLSKIYAVHISYHAKYFQPFFKWIIARRLFLSPILAIPHFWDPFPKGRIFLFEL